MKILWVSHFLPYPETGHGALQRSRGLLLEMAKKHDIYLLAYDRIVGIRSKNVLKKAQDDLQGFCKKVDLVPYSENGCMNNRIFLALRGAFKFIPFSVSFYKSNHLLKQAVILLETHKIDILHAETLGLTDQIFDRTKIKSVLNHHNIESDMMCRRASKTNHIIKKFFYYHEARMLEAYESRICPKYSLNVCVSELDRKRLVKINKNIKTGVIENPVDCNYFKFEQHRMRGRTLIFVGSLDWYPNANAMITFCESIWPYLKKNIPELKLIIVGKNPPNQLLKITKKQRDINVMGYVNDVRPLIKGAAVYVCPIQDGGGTRLKILDALSQGIPIIANPIAVEGIDLTDGINILIAKTKEQFLKKLKLLFSNENLYEMLSIKGRKFVEKNYSTERLGEKMIKLYDSIDANLRVKP